MQIPSPRPYYGICTTHIEVLADPDTNGDTLRRECPAYGKGTSLRICPECGEKTTRVLQTVRED